LAKRGYGRIAALGLTFLGQAAWSQDDPADTFVATIDVRVINIETVVTDGQGNRVPDLGPDDFRLLVDGEEREIDYFSEIRDGQTMVSGESGTVAAVLPAADSPVPDAIPTNYLVFIDDVFPRGAHRDLVLKKLRGQIEDLGPVDQMSIMAFDGRRLEALSDWTRSPEELRRALTQAAKRPAAGAFRDQERRNFGGGTLAAANFFSEMPFSQATGYATLRESQLRAVIGAASTAIRVAGRPDGRKVMLLLSGGWPYEVLSPGSLQSVSEATFGPGKNWDTNLWTGIQKMNTLNYFLLFPRGLELYQMLTDTANRMSYTLYPVDVPGLGWTGRDVASEGGLMTARAAPVGVDRESKSEGTLMLLANQTGGRALLNDLRLDALGRAAKDTRSYYWLGFQVEAHGDDERHRIKVETRHKGLDVRARKNYVDLSRESEAAMATEAALYLKKSDDLGLIVTVGKIRQVTAKRIEVPLKLSIPIDKITIMPIEQGWAAYLEINIQARDDRANVSDLQTAPVNLLSRTEPESGSRTVYEMWVTLGDHNNDLAVTVRDLTSEATLTTFARVDL